ncbi:MAG TPA: hypothetical protein VES20_20405 [Bryobacteraceae bacterium]|nr:hypothetical protein [Bryobacteraceae bacterium]
MDVWYLIDELHRERKRLDRLIHDLEGLKGGTSLQSSSSRRGRRTMPDDERKEVSQRMKAWWQNRRQSGSDGAG